MKKKNIELYIIMLIAIFSRLFMFGKFPGGVNVDEAFAGYESWSLINYGMDSWGYTNPVYFIANGSGMNVLNSYLMMPFVYAFGLNKYTIRIPQVVFGILTVYVLYLLIKKIDTRENAYIGAFLLAISPWYIIISRYGLESNLAIIFVLLGIYFLILGIEKDGYLIISSLFWGLSLYCYAACWFFVPLFLMLSVIYCLYTKKLRVSPCSILAVVILFIMAVPLLLFIMVNMGYISEIRTSWISIPKLVVFRNDEVSLKKIIEYAQNLFRLFVKQNDYHIWNVSKWFGMYYLYSTPLVVLGGVIVLRDSIRAIGKKQFCYNIFICIWVITGIVIALFQGVGITRNNTLLIANFILLATGIKFLIDKYGKTCAKAVGVIYLISYLIFEGYYFTIYQDIISENQISGADKTLEYALDKKDELDVEHIFITSRLRPTQVLFYTKTPTDKYISSVTWENYPSKYLQAASFDCFTWRENDRLASEILIVLASEAEEYEQKNYDVTYFENCAVVISD